MFINNSCSSTKPSLSTTVGDELSRKANFHLAVPPTAIRSSDGKKGMVAPRSEAPKAPARENGEGSRGSKLFGGPVFGAGEPETPGARDCQGSARRVLMGLFSPWEGRNALARRGHGGRGRPLCIGARAAGAKKNLRRRRRRRNHRRKPER